MERAYDVCLHGASGYTARFILEELLREGGSSLRVALSGRSEGRVREAVEGHSAVLRDLMAKHCAVQKLSRLPFVECDATDPASVARMVRSCRVVVAAAGPFSVLGLPVVEACVAAGTHYVDITGEPLFVERCFAFHEAALKKGVSIVNTCGFDCVPSDVCVEELRRRFPTAKTIEGFLVSNAHGNVGTLFTAVEGVRNAGKLAELRRGSQRPKLPAPPEYRKRSFFRSRRHGYCVVFPGADPTILRNSQIWRHELAGTAPIGLGLYFSTPSLLVFVAVLWIGVLIYLAARFRVFERALRAFPSLLTLGVFGNEPDPASLQSKFAEWRFDVTLADGSRKTARMRLEDPGYKATATCVVACALCLVTSEDKCRRGNVTPAVAFAEAGLLKRLADRGTRLEIE